jgi:hypothetical protein
MSKILSLSIIMVFLIEIPGRQQANMLNQSFPTSSFRCDAAGRLGGRLAWVGGVFLTGCLSWAACAADFTNAQCCVPKFRSLGKSVKYYMLFAKTALCTSFGSDNIYVNIEARRGCNRCRKAENGFRIAVAQSA